VLLPQLLVGLFQADTLGSGWPILEQIDSRVAQFGVAGAPHSDGDQPFCAYAVADSDFQDAAKGTFIDRAIEDSICCRLGEVGKIRVLERTQLTHP
jgi:hypothetical protein